MRVTFESILMIIRSTLNREAINMDKVIDLKILEFRSITKIQAEVFCSILKGSFKDSLGDFGELYSHFLECGNFILIKGDRIVGHNESVAKVYRRISKLLLATASDEEVSLYSQKKRISKKYLISERNKFEERFRKKKKGDKK